MHIYKNKKGEERYIVAGEVFETMDDVISYFVKTKNATPGAINAYLDKYRGKEPITKKQAISILKEQKGIGAKKASNILG